jgi:hypothetical protein
LSAYLFPLPLNPPKNSVLVLFTQNCHFWPLLGQKRCFDPTFDTFTQNPAISGVRPQKGSKNREIGGFGYFLVLLPR